MSIPHSQHQQYETIVAIAQKLREYLLGSVLEEAYTLSLQELVMVFSLPQNRWMVITLTQDYQTCFWWFGTTKPNKPSNAQPCFEDLFGHTVLEVVMHEQNRSFAVKCSSAQLVFKCYDALVNVLLIDTNGDVVDLFRKRIENDWLFSVNTLHEALPEIAPAAKYYVYKRSHPQYPYYFSLQPCADELVIGSDDVLEVLQTFSRLSLSFFKFYRIKQRLLASKRAELKKLEASLLAAQQSVVNQSEKLSNEQIGHLLMANLHLIKEGMSTIEVFDFYHQVPLVIKLKKDLNAQQNAAYYYRKHKNSFIEAEQIKQKVQRTRHRMETLKNDCMLIEASVSIKDIRSFIPKEQVTQTTLPYRQFECDGFAIWVGKSASSNDELTMRHAHKNDLWLHAKDVSGSHVLVKWKPGKAFPATVISYAASLAAYYSKLKGSNLVPVIYTPRKFIRKPKGFAPGQVVVEKEEVILIEPYTNG